MILNSFLDILVLVADGLINIEVGFDIRKHTSLKKKLLLKIFTTFYFIHSEIKEFFNKIFYFQDTLMQIFRKYIFFNILRTSYLFQKAK